MEDARKIVLIATDVIEDAGEEPAHWSTLRSIRDEVAALMEEEGIPD